MLDHVALGAGFNIDQIDWTNVDLNAASWDILLLNDGYDLDDVPNLHDPGARHNFSLPLPGARSNRDLSHLTESNRSMEKLAAPKLTKVARTLEELQASRSRV